MIKKRHFTLAFIQLSIVLALAALIGAVYGAACGLTCCWRYVVSVTTMTDAGWNWLWAPLTVIGILAVLQGLAQTIYETMGKKPKNSIGGNIVMAFVTMVIAAAIVALVYMVYGIIRVLVWGCRKVVLMLVLSEGWWPTVVAVFFGLIILAVILSIFAVMLAIALAVYDSKHKQE